MPVTVYPKGTTIYKPKKCSNGYTLFPLKLIDMNGRVVNEWKLDSSRVKAKPARARLLKNGHIIVLRGASMAEDTGAQEYDWDSRLVWEYFPPLGYVVFHHDIFRKANGNTLLICRETIPEEYMKKVREPKLRNSTMFGDAILEVTPAGRVVWEWHGYKYLDLNHYRIVVSPHWHGGGHNNTLSDWMHVNTVQALPENKWHEIGDQRFKVGNIMISPRTLDTIYIIDKDTKKIVWSYSGDYMGGLSGQHEPHMIEKGLPGEGNILVLDNGASPYKDLRHAGRSYVLEINPVSKEIVWKYENGEQFHSCYTSSSQRLLNGNTLINETTGRRIFEVTTEGEIVWEYVYIKRVSARAYRYSYDYCPQTKTLGKPKQIPVIPLEDMRISPAKIPVE